MICRAFLPDDRLFIVFLQTFKGLLYFKHFFVFLVSQHLRKPYPKRIRSELFHQGEAIGKNNSPGFLAADLQSRKEVKRGTCDFLDTQKFKIAEGGRSPQIEPIYFCIDLR